LSLLLAAVSATPLLKTTGDFECPGPGIWADPDNCQCYYNCANHVAYQTCCSDGTLFDETYMDCDYDDLVDCGDRPRPGSTRPPVTTTAAPQTTTPSQITTTASPSTTTDTPLTTTDSSMTTTAVPRTTTATDSKTTTTHPGPYPGYPAKVMGMYILLADDTEEGFGSDSDWEPQLYPYQQNGANVLFFTFINPATMDVPLAFKKLAATRGTDSEGAVPADTRIIFAIGGYEYSLRPNPWDWLTSREKAESMAVKVAQWRDDYGIDGIDLDIEEGAGSNKIAGPNLVHFVRKIKSIHPDLLIGQPTYGYPQIAAEIDVINASWQVGGTSNNIADSVGLMVYEGTQALNYVKNYAAGSSQWEGFPIKVDVPKPSILLGCKGSSSTSSITTLAREAIKQDLLGVMVWYCSVRNGLKYQETWDCTGRPESENGYVAAMEMFEEAMNN